MLGFRKLKMCSIKIPVIIGLVMIGVSYKWFFDHHIHRVRSAGQLTKVMEQASPAQSRIYSPSIANHNRINNNNNNQLPGRSVEINNLHHQSNVDSSKNSNDMHQNHLLNNPSPNIRKKPSQQNVGQSPENKETKANDVSQSLSKVDVSRIINNDNNSNNNGSAESRSKLKASSEENSDPRYNEAEIKRFLQNQKKPTHSKRMLRDRRVEIQQNRGPDGVTQKVEVRRLHRSFSHTGLASGNMYTTDIASVVHVVTFADQSSFKALMAMANSVTKNSQTPNVTFHFVTSPEDRLPLKKKIDGSPLESLAYEVIEFPPEWAQGRDMLEFGPFRISDLLPYMGGHVVILDPHCLVKGDIIDLVGTTIRKNHWAAMPSLCNTDTADTVPDERYGHYINFSHPAIRKLNMSPDTCVPSPAVMVFDLNSIRIANTRRKMWGWIHFSDKNPVFMKLDGKVPNKGAYSVVFYDHVTLIKNQWYTRLNEKSSLPVKDDSLLYHWVGTKEPWNSDCPAAGIWKTYLIRSSDDEDQ